MRFSTGLLGGALMAALALGIVTAAPASAETTKITLLQQAPIVKTNEEIVGIGTVGSNVYFEGALSNKAKQQVGTILGRTSIIDVTPEGSTELVRYRELVFTLSGGQIVAIGASNYQSYAKDVPASADAPGGTSIAGPVTIAIVGGTGKYRSARGEVVTTKLADGTFKHVLMLDR